MERASDQSSTSDVLYSEPMPPGVVATVRDVRCALAGVEGLLEPALGVGSHWDWRPLAEALEHVEQARRLLPEVDDEEERG